MDNFQDLRDKFAGDALIALGNLVPIGRDGVQPRHSDWEASHRIRAEYCYAQADAMLAARALKSGFANPEARELAPDAPRKRPYADYTEWHGGQCPVPQDTMIDVVIGDGREINGKRADSLDWTHHGAEGDILFYRVVAS